MSKREIIIQMIADAPERNGNKMITQEAFKACGLYASLEDGQHSPDLKYTMRIANELGYRCSVGLALGLFPNELLRRR